MCAPDPNRGIRMQAKIEHRKKMGQYKSEQLKYWNRETSYVRGKSRIGTGLSRSQSDAYSKAMATLGVARTYQADYEREKAGIQRHSDESGVSYSNRRNLGQYQKILAKQAQVESSINNTFGRNYDTLHQGIVRGYQNKIADNRQKLGVRPEFGAPVFMPPRDRAGQNWANLQMGMSVLSSGIGIAAIAAGSDIRLKENIDQVGVSPLGYKIYEWNYRSAPNTRYRGVIAQDVMKKNPMAVTIQEDNMLAVYYDELDVDLEVLV